MRRKTGLNPNSLLQITPFGSLQKKENEGSEKSQSSLQSIKEKMKNSPTNPENPYLLKISRENLVNQKRHSVSYQKTVFENINNTNITKSHKISPVKAKMKEVVEKVLNDEEFIKKEFPSFKIEKILKPGESYGADGLEYMTKKF